MISVSLKKCPDSIRAQAVLRSEAGMATGIVMVVAAIMAVMALGILGLNREHSIRDIRYTLFHSMLDIVNINLYAIGQNDRAFKSTVYFNYNSNGSRMSCIRNGTLCDIVVAGVKVQEDIVLRYPTTATSGSTYYDQMKATGSTRDGFRLDGSVCNYDDTAAPFDRVINGCVLSVRVRWQAFCITDCTIPPNRMIFDLTYDTPTLDQRGNPNRSFLPVTPEAQNGPIPIYNPFR